MKMGEKKLIPYVGKGASGRPKLPLRKEVTTIDRINQLTEMIEWAERERAQLRARLAVEEWRRENR
jgi:hypothetical protein